MARVALRISSGAIGFLYSVFFGGTQAGLNVCAESVGVGNGLAVLADTDDDGENLLIDVGEILGAPLCRYFAGLQARGPKHRGSHGVLLGFQNDEQLDFRAGNVIGNIDADFSRLHDMFPATAGAADAEILKLDFGGNGGGRNRQVDETQAGQSCFDKFREQIF